jgi:hypothetical protein
MALVRADGTRSDGVHKRRGDGRWVAPAKYAPGHDPTGVDDATTEATVYTCTACGCPPTDADGKHPTKMRKGALVSLCAHCGHAWGMATGPQRDRQSVMLDGQTLAAVDAEVRRRRLADGGTHSRASVLRDAVDQMVQRWSEAERAREVGK